MILGADSYIISYCDIVFRSDLVSALVDDVSDISVAVDSSGRSIRGQTGSGSLNAEKIVGHGRCVPD